MNKKKKMITYHKNCTITYYSKFVKKSIKK